MKQLTFQFEGFAPENIPVRKELEGIVKQSVVRTIGVALSHRTAVGGVALISGMVLATGADTIPQALLTLAAFVVAGACLHEKQEKGGVE